MAKSYMSADLTKGNVSKTLISFTLPILLGNIFQQLYNVADSIVVGRILGENSLAAVGASFGISNIILAIAMGITTGIGIVISNLFGENKRKQIQNAVDTGLCLVLILSIIITLFGVLKTDFLLSVFNVPPSIMAESISYLKIIFIGTNASFFYNAITNFLRGIGDSRSPLIFLIVSSVLNIILDVLFVGGLSMGVKGAAIATVISQFFVFIICVIHINKKKYCFKIRIRNIRIDINILKCGLKIGIPATLQQLFISIGSSVLQILINGFGATYITAYTAASRIDAFATMPAVNIGKAMSNFVAQNEGANKHDRIKKGIRSVSILMAVISIFTAVIIYCSADKLIAIFCDSENVIKEGVNYLYIISTFYIIFSFMQLLNGILLGKGRSIVSMISTIVSFCFLQVPTAYFLSEFIGITGVWIAAPVGWIGGFLIRLLYYNLKYNKKL